MQKRVHGFSLVELSIVLVILGLLTGGILSGQSLIRASELRAAVSEYQRYTASVQSFRDKYMALPGDMPNADQFWGYEGGAVANCSATYTGTTARSGTCDGNGGGTVEDGTAVSSTAEIFQFWKQMALAGLIEGSYTGFAGPTAAGSMAGHDAVPGVNVPKSKMSNSGWSARGNNVYWAGDASSFPGNYGNFFILGGLNPGDMTSSATMKPEEAWNIDTKLDDGKPGTGKVLAYGRTVCTSSTGTTLPITDGASATYNLSLSSNLCSLIFTNAF